MLTCYWRYKHDAKDRSTMINAQNHRVKVPDVPVINENQHNNHGHKHSHHGHNNKNVIRGRQIEVMLANEINPLGSPKQHITVPASSLIPGATPNSVTLTETVLHSHEIQRVFKHYLEL